MLFTEVQPLFEPETRVHRTKSEEAKAAALQNRINRYRNAFYNIGWQGTTRQIAEQLNVAPNYTSISLREFMALAPGYMIKAGEVPKVAGRGKGIYIWEWIEDERIRDAAQEIYLIEINSRRNGIASERRVSARVRR